MNLVLIGNDYLSVVADGRTTVIQSGEIQSENHRKIIEISANAFLSLKQIILLK